MYKNKCVCVCVCVYNCINNIFKIFRPEELQQMVQKNVEFVLLFNHLQYVYEYLQNTNLCQNLKSMLVCIKYTQNKFR